MEKSLIFAAIFMSFFIAFNVQSDDCEIPGKTIQWIADYCMYKVETDDLFDEKVQICLERNHAYTVEDNCENKKYYKMKICKLLAERGEYQGKAELCFNDLEFIPPTVKNNITDQTENKGVSKVKWHFDYLSKPYYFIPFFLVVWCAVSLLISFISGWRNLSGTYRLNFAFKGEKLRMKSVRMRWGINYSACLTISVNREGLFLALIPIFRIGHPPLFVPWNDIFTEDTKHLIFMNAVKLIFRNCPDIYIVMSKKLVERIFSMREENNQNLSYRNMT